VRSNDKEIKQHATERVINKTNILLCANACPVISQRKSHRKKHMNKYSKFD